MPGSFREPLVLCYHAVSETWPAELSVTPARLEGHLTRLLSRGYRPATFSSALGARGSERTFAVTFDDAYRSTLTVGKPILDRLGVPATVFVPTAFPGTEQAMAWPGIDMWKGGPHEAELIPLSWPELGQLAAAGWEIGSHTVTHPQLTQISDAQLARELTDSRRRCAEELTLPCDTLAYPYGDVDSRVLRAARRAGYKTAAALPARMYKPRTMEWPRVGVYSMDTPARFAVKVSPWVMALRTALGR